VECVELAEAQSVLCTGLFDEINEQPKDYAPLLNQVKSQGLPMICANPDKVVRKGEKLLYCAGALADAFAEMGGKVLMAGKPFTPIYDLAVQTAENILGTKQQKFNILAIGDGPETDIKGAADFGLPCVLITGGINEGKNLLATVQQLVPHAKILRAIAELDWT
jgi:HAD superfamily hydrolase (TIGR01459 family)